MHLSPHVGSLSQSVLALVIVLLFVITGQDPVLALFTWLTQLGTLAIIVLMAVASFAVVAFFAAIATWTPTRCGRSSPRSSVAWRWPRWRSTPRLSSAC